MKQNQRKHKLFAKPLSATINSLTKPVMKKHGLPDGLVTNWQQIIGNPLCHICLPVACKRQKKQGGATLILEVMAAHMLMVQHSSGVIKEKINMHYGYEAISQVKCQAVHMLPVSASKDIDPEQKIMAGAFDELLQKLKQNQNEI